MNQKLITLGKRLREARQRAGLSQVDVARRIGKSKQLVSACEVVPVVRTGFPLG